MDQQPFINPDQQPDNLQLEEQEPRKPDFSRVLILTIPIIAILGLGGYLIYQQFFPVACTKDARICPDGSTVGRIPPDCEFAPCPEIIDETSDWRTYRNEEYGFEVRYPSKYRVYDYTGKVMERSPTIKEYSNTLANFIKEGQSDLTAYIEHWESRDGHLNFQGSEPDFITEVDRGGYITIDYSPGVNYPVSAELREEWEIILSTFKFID